MATTVTSSTQDFVAKCTAMASDVLRLPAQHVWVDYDQEADVLYMSFRKPQKATKTIEVDEDILVRKDGRTIVGLTIMNVSTRGGRMKWGGEVSSGMERRRKSH
jgi:uncharacterized protein YuzE